MYLAFTLRMNWNGLVPQSSSISSVSSYVLLLLFSQSAVRQWFSTYLVTYLLLYLCLLAPPSWYGHIFVKDYEYNELNLFNLN